MVNATRTESEIRLAGAGVGRSRRPARGKKARPPTLGLLAPRVRGSNELLARLDLDRAALLNTSPVWSHRAVRRHHRFAARRSGRRRPGHRWRISASDVRRGPVSRGPCSGGSTNAARPSAATSRALPARRSGLDGSRAGTIRKPEAFLELQPGWRTANVRRRPRRKADFRGFPKCRSPRRRVGVRRGEVFWRQYAPPRQGVRRSIVASTHRAAASDAAQIHQPVTRKGTRFAGQPPPGKPSDRAGSEIESGNGDGSLEGPTAVPG